MLIYRRRALYLSLAGLALMLSIFGLLGLARHYLQSEKEPPQRARLVMVGEAAPKPHRNQVRWDATGRVGIDPGRKPPV